MPTSIFKSKIRKPLKKYTMFRSKIRTQHPSHEVLRTELPLLPFRSVVRLGSLTDIEDSVTNGGSRIECNTIEACRTSANKLLMKKAFDEAKVTTATWLECSKGNEAIKRFAKERYPVVMKHIYGSRNSGNTLVKTEAELTTWLMGKDLGKYIIEKFYNFNREYRLHVTKEGCFYTCRKMLKSDTPEDKRWFRNDSNCTWILEDNENFDKPSNWDKVVAECVKALLAVKLDIGAIDLRIQSAETSKGKDRKEPEMIVIETASAPSFGQITAEKYIAEIPKVLKYKKSLVS